MAQKVELHQLVDLSIDVQGGKSTVNFGLLNNLLHELIKNMGLGNVQVSFKAFFTAIFMINVCYPCSFLILTFHNCQEFCT